jgi:hypothetical protein
MSRISRLHAPFSRLLFGIVWMAAIGIGAQAHAATVAVANCKDAGPGSLRAAVGLAASGDTVDLRARHCTILLTGGEIVVPQANLRLLGPGAGALAITSNFKTRVLNHSGAGTLSVERLSLIDSTAFGPFTASAGCIRSSGSVELHHARLHRCSAYGVPDPDCEDAVCSTSAAGAIAARGDVLLSYSTISDSSVEGYYSSGGGVSAGGWVTLYRSRLLRNNADIASAAVAGEGFTAVQSLIADNEGYDGGAVYVGDVFGAPSGFAEIRGSTFTRNLSEGGDCSALCVGRSSIANSTFSGNSWDPAIASRDGASIFNSTIAFNQGWNNCRGPVRVDGALRLESTIISGNTCGSTPMDLEYAGSVIGSHNLVVASSATLPLDTLRADPRLKPLARNGGFTPTHSLADASLALNRGSNVLGLKYDQRGHGFPRTKGGCTDIGAFER